MDINKVSPSRLVLKRLKPTKTIFKIIKPKIVELKHLKAVTKKVNEVPNQS
jgi:hypothetical protein